jgi:nucleotide-binding universal stress UspA family protein/nitrite reductase/ring-hydroxylating ferredoxin subunit
MGYRRVLVGTDGSNSAAIAVQAAARMAKRLRTELLIVSAYEPPGMTEEMAASVLAHAKETAEVQRITVNTVKQRGEAADIVLQVADREGADLIVVGNKGMGQATRFRLGSVPDRVAHFAPCDLLIVDTTSVVKAGGTEDEPIRRLLVGTDGSPTAAEAARKAFELAMRLGADVVLVYVGDPLLGAIALEQTAEGGPEGVDVQRVVVQGDPAEALCSLAEERGVNLMVVGNKGMSGARRFLLGSVPNKVAHAAPTNVLVAKTVDRTVDELAPGHGGVVQANGRQVAVYKGEDGSLHAVSPRCTHMGCTVDWNDVDRTWDCPCHGSRYDVDGEVIRGPAGKPLPRETVES